MARRVKRIGRGRKVWWVEVLLRDLSDKHIDWLAEPQNKGMFTMWDGDRLPLTRTFRFDTQATAMAFKLMVS